MKAYVVIYGYSDEYELDSVFLSKEEAEAYVKKNNQIPYDDYDEFRIEELDLNPSAPDKQIVTVNGFINKDNTIKGFEIERVDRETMKGLKDFTGDDIVLYPKEKRYDVDFRNPENPYTTKEVTRFCGRIDVTPCKDLANCGSYIKEVIKKKLEKRS